MGFSNGGGKPVFCAPNPGPVLDAGVSLPPADVFIGRDTREMFFVKLM